MLRMKKGSERVRRRELGFIHVAIVGYTNAGKTTLFNVLTKLHKPTGTEMFTTLSPKTRAIDICGKRFALVDTVGFIRKIPITIIESFRVVLEEISNADIILLVVDVSKDRKRVLEEIASSIEILRSVGAIGKPIILILNKIDLVNDVNQDTLMKDLVSSIDIRDVNIVDYIPISALNNVNIDRVKEALCRFAQ